MSRDSDSDLAANLRFTRIAASLFTDGQTRMSVPAIFRSRTRPVIRILANAAAVLVTLELLTRFCLPDVKNGLQFDPEFGYRSTASVDKMVHSSESGLNFRYRTNSLGFRGEVWPDENPAHVKRVAVFGHSFTHGVSYPHELTFCGLLEERLNEADRSHKWNVMNCGISGSNTLAQFRAYEKLIKDRKPDVVVCCFAVSTDVKSSSTAFTKSKWPSVEYAVDGELVFHSPENRTGHDLRNNSRFHVWQKKKVQSLVDRIREPLKQQGVLEDERPEGNATREFSGLAMTDRSPSEELNGAWRISEEMLSRFQQSVEQTGAEFVLVSIPMAWQVYPDLYEAERIRSEDPSRYDWDVPRSRLQVLLDELSIESVDLIPAFRSACPSQSIEVESEWLYLHGDGHFNAAGHQLVAEGISRFLLDRSDSEESENRSNHDRLADGGRWRTTKR